jgi:drug/metabolite transporter (DMT)-like permease
MSAGFAVIAAALFGSGDFLGGQASRRAPARLVTATAQLSGALLAIVAAVVVGADRVRFADVAWGGAAGLAGGVALLCFYWSLSRGAMSLVAPLSAVLSALTPVAYGLLTGERPNLVVLIGIAAALVAIPAVSTAGARDAQLPRRVAALASLAGFGFGVFAVCLEHTSEAAGLWPIVGARSVSLVVLIAIMLATEPARSFAEPAARRTALLAGMFDVAGRIGYLLAIHRGSLAAVGVLVGLYPAVTVVLARVVLHERLQRAQLGGLVVAGVAIVLIALGTNV